MGSVGGGSFRTLSGAGSTASLPLECALTAATTSSTEWPHVGSYRRLRSSWLTTNIRSPQKAGPSPLLESGTGQEDHQPPSTSFTASR
jgi:hypothetical protein